MDPPSQHDSSDPLTVVLDDGLTQRWNRTLVHVKRNNPLLPLQQGCQYRSTTVLDIAEAHAGQSTPIGVSHFTGDLGKAQAAVIPFVAIGKEGCNAGVGKVWQEQEGRRSSRGQGVDMRTIVAVSGTPGLACRAES